MKKQNKAGELGLKITKKNLSEDLDEKGDYCIVNALGNIKNDKTIRAIVMLCPYCGLSMATTSVHKISLPRFEWLSKLLTSLRIQRGVTVTPVIQCPYNPSHKFNIKRGKIFI